MKILSLVSIVFFYSIVCVAIEPIDGYYSDDLLGAVDEAKERPHHYDYSNTYRYKRTTAQSIHLNQVNLEELEETHLSIANKSVKDDDRNFLALDSNTRKLKGDNLTSLDNKNNSLNLPTIALPKNTAISVSSMGELSSTGILNNSSIHSTPRP